MRSANTAISSMAITMAAPTAPKGLRRANRRHASGARASVRAGPPAWARGAGATPAGALVADAGVEDGIERVHAQVDEHDRGDDDEVDALDHRVVTLVDGIEEKAAHARQAEDRLDDHGGAQDLGQLRAQERHHGNDRV